MAVTHAKVSAAADGADTNRVRPIDWNAAHTVEDATITEAKLSLSDVTTKDATVSVHGLMPKNDKRQLSRQSVGNITGATTADFTAGTAYEATLTGNVTFTFTAPSAGSAILMQLKQDATGSRLVTWPASVIWPGGTAPTLTTTVNKIDIINFYFDGTNYRGQTGGLNYS